MEVRQKSVTRSRTGCKDLDVGVPRLATEIESKRPQSMISTDAGKPQLDEVHLCLDPSSIGSNALELYSYYCICTVCGHLINV